MVPNAQKFMERRGKTNCKNVETANFFEGGIFEWD